MTLVLPETFSQRNRFSTKTILISLISITIFISVYSFLCVWHAGAIPLSCDTEAHAQLAPKVFSGELRFPNIGFYSLIMLLTLGKTDYRSLIQACYVMLAFAVTLKWIITQKILCKWLTTEKTSNHEGLIATTLAFALLLSMNYSLPGEPPYLGKVPPNVWHNTTTIVMFPAALILFSLSLNFLSCPHFRTACKMAGMVIITAIIKPSFLFCFVPAFSLMLVVLCLSPKCGHFSFRAVSYGLTVSLWASVIIGLQAWYLYGSNNTDGVDIAPFVVWKSLTVNWGLALVLSIPFPLSVVMLFTKDSLQDLRLQFSWLLFLAALVAFILLAERQERRFDGNFVWQVISANYLLFLSSVGLLISKTRKNTQKIRSLTICWFSLFGHFAYGVKYLFYLGLGHNCF